MSSPFTCPARNPALWLAAALVLAGPARAEEYLPVAEDRVVERVDSRVQAPLAQRRTEGEGMEEQQHDGWNLALAVSAAYDDNINLAQVHRKADLVVGITPEIEFAKGQIENQGAAAQSGAYIRLAYRPTAVLYMENGSQDRVDHEVLLRAGWRGKAIAVAYSGAYRRLGDATADTGTPTQRNEYESTARVIWSPREKIAVTAGLGINGTDYDNRALNDTRTIYGEVSLRYAYSPKTKLALIYRYGRDDVEGTGDQTIHRAAARLDWQPRQKIDVSLEAGLEHRSYDLGSGTKPVLEARIDWRPRAATNVFLAGYYRTAASGFLAGQNYSAAGVRAGLSESLGHGWTATLEGGYEHSSYERVAGSGPSGRVDQIYYIRPGIDYALNERLKIGAYYQFSKDNSNRPAFGYSDHQVGILMRYEF